MVVATSVPYLWNFASTPRGYHYTWILPPYSDDSLAYMAWTQQAANGALLFKVKYTALPQSAFLFHPFFLIAGWLARFLGCDIGIIHLALKEIGVVLFFLTFYKYIDYLRLNEFQSVSATVLLGISSGVGGLFGFADSLNRLSVVPADLWMPEVSTYWSLLWNPLFPYSLALILLTIFLLDRGTRESRKADLYFAGLATGVLALIHPYSQPLLLVFALCIIIGRRRAAWLGYLLPYFSILLPFFLYVILVSMWQPVVAQHSSRGTMLSPSITAYILGFGFPLLIWMLGFTVKQGWWMKEYWQLVLWFILSLGLAYVPWWFQRKLIFGAHVPLCILAGIAFDLILSRYAVRNWAPVFAIALIPLLASTAIYLFLGERREVRDNGGGAYYISNQTLDGMKFLKQKKTPDAVVLATIATSSLIPAFSGNTVVWGHWAMSVDFKERQDWYTKLFVNYQNWDDENRSREFWGSGIDYIFADSRLKMSIEREPIKWFLILRDADEVFRNDTVVIYKLRASRPASLHK